MTDTTAKIRAKGLDATGVTEDIAAEMYHNKGRHYMGIVELRVDETHDKADGTRKVDLVLTQVEPATDDSLAEHLRELTRTLYYNRGTNPEQLSLQHGDEPTVAAVLEAGAKHRPHPFLPVDAADERPLCDVCGYVEAAGVHSQQAILLDAEEDDEDDLHFIDAEDDDQDKDDAAAVVLDHAPNAFELANIAHIHHGGRCVKNRHDEPCDYDDEDLEHEPDNVTTLPDPFTAPA